MTSCITTDSSAPGFFFTESQREMTFFLWYPDLIKMYLRGEDLWVQHSTGTLQIQGKNLRDLMRQLARESVAELRLSLPVENKTLGEDVVIEKMLWTGDDLEGDPSDDQGDGV